MPKLQYSQIILSYKYWYKVLSQNKSWDSIPSLGLHLIQREVFSSLHNPPQNPLQRDLSFLHFATKLAHIEQNNTTSEYQAPHIYSKITEGSASTIVHPRMKAMLAFNVNVIPNLDNAPKSQKREVITCRHHLALWYFSNQQFHSQMKWPKWERFSFFSF